MLAGKGQDGSGGRGRKSEKPSVNSYSGFTGQSRDLIGAQFGVSGPTVDRGRRVVEKGVPELIQAVETGTMSVSKAAMVGARARDFYNKQAKERQKEHAGTAPGKTKDTGETSYTSVSGKSRDQAAKAAGVSGRTVVPPNGWVLLAVLRPG